MRSCLTRYARTWFAIAVSSSVLGLGCGGDGTSPDPDAATDSGIGTTDASDASSMDASPDAPIIPDCGDGVRSGPEICDLGAANNTGAYDGCNANCTRAAFCGDGTENGPEACDFGVGGNMGEYGGCNADCTRAAFCGDGMADGTEECDLGTASNTGAYDGCNADCTRAASCGDGVANGTEACDLGEASNTGAYGGCNMDCTLAPRCGDGVTIGGEACDLGTANNTGAYDGCNANCTLAPRCGDGMTDVGEACDLGTAGNMGYGTCNADCTAAAFCGDGITNGPEQCDRGAQNANALMSPCSTSCTYTSLLAWFDGSDPYGDGTSPSMSGEAMPSWVDKARGADASQATASARPTYAPASVGGAGAMSFDGHDDFFDVPVNIDASVRPDVTIIAVYVSLDADPQARAGVWGHDDGDSALERFLIADGSEGTTGFSIGDAIVAVAGIGVPSTSLITATTLRGVGPSTVYVNGALGALSSEFHSEVGPSHFSIGSLDAPSHVVASHQFDGLIAEVLVFDRALTNAERNAIGAALAAKYGLISYCGDGTATGTEGCDDGINDGSPCDASCQPTGP